MLLKKVPQSLIVLFLTQSLLSIGAASETEVPPNIVFFLTDDQAKISLGCYSDKDEVKTPNIDRLAERGVVFDRHYVTTAICMASRASIMTGLYEYRHGCNFDNGNLKPRHWKISYPMVLRANGYRTAFAGKFGFEIEGQSELPSDDFDKWGGGPGQTSYRTAKNASMKKYAKRYPHATRAYGAFGQDFVRESVEVKKPFCLSISFKSPHRPVQPDPEFDEVYRGAKFTKPDNYGREHGKHLAPQSRTGRQFPRFEEWGYSDRYDEVMARYNQQIYGVDQAVGMVLKELEEQGVADNTVVIFTSDNGFLCGSHGYGSKVLPYEESTCVPMIIHDPRHPSAGKKQRVKTITGGIDIAPTILQLAGVGQPLDGGRQVDGRSLLPCLDEPETPVRESLVLMNCWGPDSCQYFAFVKKESKYCFWPSQKNGMRATEELFNPYDDPGELTNLALNEDASESLRSARAEYAKHLGHLQSNVAENYSRFSSYFDPAARKKKRQPNLILMMADDLGWGDVGFHGNTDIQTPCLDEMARAGLRLERFYAASAVCSPTRGSCITGRNPNRYGISTANTGKMLGPEITIAEMAKEAGYRTGHFGKWHLGTLTTEVRDSNRGGKPDSKKHFAPPWQHGFDVCFSTEAKVPTWDPMLMPAAFKNGETKKLGWNPLAGDAKSKPYGTYYWNEQGERVNENLNGDDSRVIMDRAVEFVQQSAANESPFVAVVWFHAPHLPCVAGGRFAEMYRDRSLAERNYFGCISALDAQVGRLRAELEKLGIADDTILCFTSDNGPEGSRQSKSLPGSAGKFRGRKRSLHEGGIRVPGIMVWPNEIEAGLETNEAASTSDYLPTFASIIGAKKVQPVSDGVSLEPLFKKNGQLEERGIGFRFQQKNAFMKGDYKIVRESSKQEWELYDLNSDPSEQIDLSELDAAKTAELVSEFEAWNASCKRSAAGEDYEPANR